MRKTGRLVLGFFLLITLLLAAVYAVSQVLTGTMPGKPAIVHPAPNARIDTTYGILPLQFEENRGQVDSRVKFLSHGKGYSLFITDTEAVFTLTIPEYATKTDAFEEWQKFAGTDFLNTSGSMPFLGTLFPSVTSLDERMHSKRRSRRIGHRSFIRETYPSFRTDVLRMKCAGANVNVPVSGSEKLPGVVNYFKGNDPKKWHANIPTYQKVKLAQVYKGIDLVYYGRNGLLEYDFVVAPGADPSVIALEFEGADSLEVDTAGNLIAHLPGGDITQLAPEIYQVVDGNRKKVAGNYVLTGKNLVSFKVPEYLASLPLVIDPSIAYSTYLGGTDSEYGNSVFVDSTGCAYVTGYTYSTDFPTLTPVQANLNDMEDVYVTKFNAAGNTILYSTYLGGASSDYGWGITVDNANCAYITGYTLSNDFPIQNQFQLKAGAEDAFLTKLNAAGNAMMYSTYYGGSLADGGCSVAVDNAGYAYVAGATLSNDFPVWNAGQPFLEGGNDAFVVKFYADGSDRVYASYFGGSSDDVEYLVGIAADSAGYAYVTGATSSTDFPTLNAYQASHADNGVYVDGYVAKVLPDGSSVVYSTYIGGAVDDDPCSIAIDSAGCAYIFGDTQSNNYPTLNAYQGARSGDWDCMVTKFNASGNGLVYSTFLGGTNLEYSGSIRVDIFGCAYVSGQTASANFPVQNPVQGAYGGGTSDAFLTKFSAAGNTLDFSTFLGGTDSDYGYSTAIDNSGGAYVLGRTYSANFPVANAYQGARNGTAYDAFLTKYADVGQVPTYIVTLTPAADAKSANPGANAVYTINVKNDGNMTDTFNITKTACPWGAVLSSTTVGPLAAGASQDITLTVSIPGGTAGGASQAITVTGTSQTDGSKTDTTVCTTTCNTVRGVSLSPGASAASADPAATHIYTLTVTNNGNAADTFTISKAGNAWTSNLSTNSVALGAGASQDITVAVTVPAGAASGATDAVTVTATSQGDNSKTASSTLTTTCNLVRGVTITTGSAAGTTNPGTTLSYTLTVKNTGNAADTFSITKAGNVWTSNLSAVSLNLAAGAQQDITVDVTVPAGALSGATDAVTVTATSQGDNSKTASSTLTTTAGTVHGVQVNPAAESKHDVPGTVLTYTLTVTNKGNTTDSFDVTHSTPKGWVTGVAPATITNLAVNATANVTVTVTIPANALKDENEISTVTVTSQTDGTKTATATLTTTSDVVYGVQVNPAAESKHDVPGTILTYTVTVTNKGNTPDSFTVTHNSPTNWVTGVAPANINNLAVNATANITVTVTIPANALKDENEISTVTVTSQTDGTKTATATLTTTADVVYGVQVNPAAESKHDVPGTTLTYTITVTNKGNTPDSFTVTHNSPTNWVTGVAPANINNLAVNATANVTVTVTIPGGALKDENEVSTVTVTSAGDGSKTGTATLTTTADIINGVQLSPVAESKHDLPGSTLTYTLTVTNKGNASDNFTVTHSTPKGWVASVVPANINNLGVNATANVTVTVTIPANALRDENEVSTVTVTSQTDGSKTATATLTTTADVVYGVQVAPGADAKHTTPGGTLTYTLTVTNKGNAPDTFTVAHTTPKGWVTSVVPGTINNLAVNGTANVTVTVAIPANAVKDENEISTVTVTSQGDASKNAAAALTTTTDLSKGISMTPAVASSDGNPGTGIVYTLTLNNTGNDTDTFALNRVSSQGWVITASADPVTIGAYGSTTVDITVNVPAAASGGVEDTTTVTAVSNLDGTVTDASTLTTTAGAVRAVGIAPAAAADSDKPATDVSYVLTVTNNGNATDTFDLAQVSTWPCILSTAEITNLAPGASGNVTVTVEIPDGAAMNSTGTTTVTVLSRADNSKTSQSVLTTTAQRECLVSASPAAQAGTQNPGAAVTYTATVKNEGNAPDTFLVNTASTRGWQVVTSQNVIGPLASGASEDITVTVTIPEAATPVADTETVTFASQGDNTVSTSCTMTTTAGTTTGVSVNPTTTGTSGKAGTTVPYTLTVQNTSNAADTFALAITGNGWNTAVTEDGGSGTPINEITVNAGAGKTVTITVTIPETASGGSSDTAVFRVTSTRNPAQTASSTITTTVTGTPGDTPGTPAIGIPKLQLPENGSTVQPIRPNRIDFQWKLHGTIPASYHCHLFAGTTEDLKDAVVVNVPVTPGQAAPGKFGASEDSGRLFAAVCSGSPGSPGSSGVSISAYSGNSGTSGQLHPLASLPLLFLGGFLVPGWRRDARNRSRLLIALLASTALLFTFCAFTGCGSRSGTAGTGYYTTTPAEGVTLHYTIDTLPPETICYWRVGVVNENDIEVASSETWSFTVIK